MTDEYKSDIITKFIVAYERMRDKIHFPVKTPTDDLICPICGGRYKRRDKSKHAKRNKHKKMLPLVLEGRVFPSMEWEETEQDMEDTDEDEE